MELFKRNQYLTNKRSKIADVDTDAHSKIVDVDTGTRSKTEIFMGDKHLQCSYDFTGKTEGTSNTALFLNPVNSLICNLWNICILLVPFRKL